MRFTDVLGRSERSELSLVEAAELLGLYRDLYRGFTVKHFHEQLGKRHAYTLGYTVTKVHLHRGGLVQAAIKRSAHRTKRPLRTMVAMMLHQDASTHAWLAGDRGKQDIVVTMDDATSAIYSMFPVDTFNRSCQPDLRDTLPAQPFCPGACPRTEQERSGQITSDKNRTG